MNRTASFLAPTGYVKNNYLTRRHLKYYETGFSMIMEVKAMGTMGDLLTDDTLVLNATLQKAIDNNRMDCT